MRVRALGEPDVWVGEYDLKRRRGGDVFTLKPITRKRNVGTKEKPEWKDVTFTPEMQFSKKWMEKVPDSTPETHPVHFNKGGRGDARRVKEAEHQAGGEI